MKVRHSFLALIGLFVVVGSRAQGLIEFTTAKADSSPPINAPVIYDDGGGFWPGHQLRL